MSIKEISISIQRSVGVYSCDYQVEKLGRLINSQPSKNVHVTILADLTTKSPFTILKTPTYQGDREMITKTPTSYNSTAEYSTSYPASQTSTDTGLKFKEIETSTIQSYTFPQLTNQTIWMNSSSIDIGVLLTTVYYSIGSLLCALVMVLLIFLLCKFCLHTKGKKSRPMKSAFWTKFSTRRKSMKTTPFPIPMTVYEKEEESVYEQPDPCTTLTKPSSSPKPSNNQGSFAHCVDLGSYVYDAL
ncbi:hypothetical protein PRIEUP_LOCUS352, partial [Pristimantis euphronides]